MKDKLIMARKKESKKPNKRNNIEKEYGLLKIDGKYYYADSIDGKPVFRQISKTKVKKRLKLVDEIVEKLKDALDKEAVLRESLMKSFPFGEDIIEEELLKLHGMLHSKDRKYKPKTRKDHCVDMKVGNFVLPIVD